MSSTPLTVLIVDDEQPLREELRMVPWPNFGAELAGEAENGEEALRLCEVLQPDVVITDITMPVMDGLELAKRIRSRYPLTQVVLLTCHSEFGYAKEALKLGALEYLIKISLEEEEIDTVLGKAREAIRREQMHRRSERESRRWELSKRLTRLIKEGPAKTRPEHGLSDWTGTVPDVPVIAARLHAAAGPEDRFDVRLALMQALDRPGMLPESVLEWIPQGETDYMLWLNAGEGGPDRADQELQSMTELMGKLEAELERQLPYLSEAVKLITIVSDPIASVEQLYSALKETTPRETALFYHRSGQAIAVHTAARETSLISLKDKADVERRWTQLAEQPGELAAYVQEEWAAWAASHKVLPAELKAWAVQLYGRVCAASGREEPEPETGLARLLEAQSVSQLAGDLSGLIEAVPGEPRKCRREVRLAKRILSERLAEPLTLTSVAEEVGLSSFYLSRLFREEVGESFNAYLTRLRVDKAIRLLQTTPLKVYEVAERVGIPSYRYFSVLFRNRTGVSPTDYKKG